MKFKYQWTIILIGCGVILLPLIHFPSAWETIIHVILGLFTIVVGALIGQYHRHDQHHEDKK
ncbi:hypothetical protein A2997_02015 [Candidatus Nomurabacteria bacterium RIFCSPLOWO2_01_FULL_36_10b]|uniref:Uncharacterized protein n=1 Tax=Candidatus Nomurabacteria bacterium RIFCSPLOWO2_01_FULL_36_10b TaxID=1801766 RepID=A0A1F6WPA4_9BACT|nr:MAG: hypothetical protein A2997_02015 [Candidatus Nomurabacteria bacterium RIFCSPLOWO2_01_FULL_36_10b]